MNLVFDGGDGVIVERSSHLEMASGFLALVRDLVSKPSDQMTDLGKDNMLILILSSLLSFLFNFLF